MIPFRRGFAFALIAGLLAASPAIAADGHWVASWGAGSVRQAADAIPAGGVTYRNIVHLSLGGRQLRVTLSNRFGTSPLRVGGVGIARSVASGRVDPASARIVTFAGKPFATIAPGAMLVSDPVGVDAPALADLAVDVFLPAQPASFLTIHPMSRQTNYRADGDQRGRAMLDQPAAEMPWHVVTAIDVVAPPSDAAIVAFGDSITDGVGTTLDANRRWPNILAARLQADPRFAHLAVVDEGIGGNRILHTGGTPDGPNGQQPSGMDRWGYDALVRAGVKYVVLLEGVNDIGISSLERDGSLPSGPNNQPVSAQDLIAGMTTLIDQAHARGIKVIGATLTPFGGAKYWRPDGQAIHDALNRFIRNSGRFDGVIDFEKVTQDPAHPGQFRPGYNDRDHLHPNDAGAAAMANSIDLSLFR